MGSKPDPLYRMGIEIPARLNTPLDPRKFYAFVSEKVVGLITAYPFSAVELSPGPNFHPMNFLADAAGNNLSAYTAVELVPETVKFLESKKSSRRIHVVRRDMAQEVSSIRSGRKRCDLLVLSGLPLKMVESILKKLLGRVRFILIYAQDTGAFSGVMPGYALTFFSFPGEAPSALFASLK
jgi:hypothetical protein